MRFRIASLVTIATFFSAAFAHYTHSDDEVVYITKVISKYKYVTDCLTTVSESYSGFSLSSGTIVSISSESSSEIQSSLICGTIVTISSSPSSSGSSPASRPVSSASGSSASLSLSGSSSMSGGSSSTSGTSYGHSSEQIGSSSSQSYSHSHSGSVTSSVFETSSYRHSVSSVFSSSPSYSHTHSGSVTSSGSQSVSSTSSQGVTSQSLGSSTISLLSTSCSSSQTHSSSASSATSQSVTSSTAVEPTTSPTSISSSSSTNQATSGFSSSNSSSSSSTQSGIGSSSSSSSTVSLSSSSSSITVSSSSSQTSSISSSSSTSQSSSSSSSSSVSSTTSVSSTSSIFSSTSSSSSQSSTTSSSISLSSTSSSSTSSSSTSAAFPTSTCAYWYEDIKHQGLAPFNTGSGASIYQVFRNVTAFGAKGDGINDDTDAINAAISSGERCAPGAPGQAGACNSTTTTPAVVYFPPGTYLVSAPIIDYYYTQLVGNPNCLPVIKASSTFTAAWVIDGDEYFGYNGGGILGYGATNIFWRQIRNFIVDLTAVPPSVGVAGIHWPTGQATSLQNIVVKMSTALNNQHYGLAIEGGSGGFMTDLTFYGGKWGIWVGNQQFTMRNLTFYNSVTAIYQLWDWGWTYKGVSINNCSIGLDMSNVDADLVSQAVGSVIFIDSTIKDTPVGIKTIRNVTSVPASGGSLILENVSLNNVATAVQGYAEPLLAGTSGTTTINWGQGHVYTPNGPSTFQGTTTPNARPDSLTAGSDFYERSKPQYENIQVSQLVSVRDAGAAGDGVTDDSNILNSVLAAAAISGQIVFFDAGDYLVTKTIFVPAGVKIVGEAYPVILSSGEFFSDITTPVPVVQVGLRGDTGSIEWSDMIISTQSSSTGQAGAILIEYNLASTDTPSGIWDVHTRIGGFQGSNLLYADCPKTPDTVITPENLPTQCIAAFMSMHITTLATRLYMENNWFWTADHDVEDQNLRQITIYTGRGLLIESTIGGIWLYGTAVEHHSLYQYHLSGTSNIFLGQIQTETAYYQPNPDTTEPFPADPNYNDPVWPASGQSGWGLLIDDSYDVLIYGAGLYSFFDNYDVHCSDQGNGETCQTGILSIDDVSTVSMYNLNTVGTNDMITRGGTNIALYVDNNNGFIGTIASFRNN